MPIITATEVTVYSNISATAATITASGLIPVVQERITQITNNWFVTDLFLQGPMNFTATTYTITAQSSFASAGFADGDEVHIYNSYRNDGYYLVETVSGATLTLDSGESVVPELSGRSILISVVDWPTDLKYTAAQMVYFDYDLRAERSPGATSMRLGPWAESYGESGSGDWGYPTDVISALFDYRIARLR